MDASCVPTPVASFRLIWRFPGRIETSFVAGSDLDAATIVAGSILWAMNGSSRRLKGPDLWAAAAIALAVALGGWSAWEARSERRALERVMRAEGEALAEALGHAVENAAASGREIEEIAAARLLDLGRLLERLDALVPFDDTATKSAADDLALRGIFILGPGLSAIASHPEGARFPEEWATDMRTLAEGTADEVVFPPSGDDQAAKRFGAAVRRRMGGVVLVVMDAAEMLAFADETGPAHLIEAVARTGGIAYAMLEDHEGRTIASESAEGSEGLPDRPMELTREVFLTSRTSGRLRIGVSTAALHAAERSALRRTAISAAGAFFLVLAVGAALAAQRRAQYERLAREREARRNESLAALGRLAATVAHEVRNPLNAVSVGVQRIEREYAAAADNEGQKRLTRLIRGEVARLDGIVTKFLQLARPPELRPGEGSLDEALLRMAPLLKDGVPESLEVGVRPSGATRAYFDEDAFRQIVLNLVRNATEAVKGKGRIDLVTRRDGRWAVLEVTDNGPGVPPEDAERIFEFGFSSKSDGSGLGLPTVQRLAAELGGSVTLAPASPGGTVVRVTFPLEPHLEGQR